MNRSCIIIEDQPPAQRILQKFINDIGSLTLEGTFDNALEAIAFLQHNKIDLIFLDIHLPKISGMDFLKTLQNPPQIILTTAFSEYALESYEYNVVDYLLKPFSFQRFVQAVTKSVTMLHPEQSVPNTTAQPPNDTTFFMKSGYDLIKMDSQQIYYIKSDADYTEVVTTTKTHLSAESLKEWLGKLDATFCQIHKSYIINTSHLEKVSGNQVYLVNAQAIPIGRAYKEAFVQRYLK